jgi:U4/U6 small nuclear ribonucleoprotein PRP31
MSLAEELLADLEDEDDIGEELVNKEEAELETEVASSKEQPMQVDQDDNEGANADTLEGVVKYYDSDMLNSVMERIDTFSSGTRTAADLSGPVVSDPEYLLIVEANNLAAELDDEIGNIHKFAKEKYYERFPELETLVVQPLEYLKTAQELGNNVLKAKNNKVLEQYLTQATIMVVSVTASTTQGTELSEEGLETIDKACHMVLSVNDTKARIFEYVESRMAFIAPNMSAIIGASSAAKLMGAAGGLTNLSKMPSGHVQLLGQQKKTQSGFSQRTRGTMPHTGFIFRSEIVQSVAAVR